MKKNKPDDLARFFHVRDATVLVPQLLIDVMQIIENLENQ